MHARVRLYLCVCTKPLVLEYVYIHIRIHAHMCSYIICICVLLMSVASPRPPPSRIWPRFIHQSILTNDDDRRYANDHAEASIHSFIHLSRDASRQVCGWVSGWVGRLFDPWMSEVTTRRRSINERTHGWMWNHVYMHLREEHISLLTCLPPTTDQLEYYGQVYETNPHTKGAREDPRRRTAARKLWHDSKPSLIEQHSAPVHTQVQNQRILDVYSSIYLPTSISAPRPYYLL